MGNEQSQGAGGGKHAARRKEELELLQAIQAGDAAAVDVLLAGTPALVYAHSKEGGIWHFSAAAGNTDVSGGRGQEGVCMRGGCGAVLCSGLPHVA